MKVLPEMAGELKNNRKKGIDRKIQPCYANCTKTHNTVDTPTEQEVRYGIFHGVYAGDRSGGAGRRDPFGYIFEEVMG